MVANRWIDTHQNVALVFDQHIQVAATQHGLIATHGLGTELLGNHFIRKLVIGDGYLKARGVMPDCVAEQNYLNDG